MDCSPPGFSFYGILQARILEWVAIPSSRGSFHSRDEPMFLMSPALTGELFIADHLGSLSVSRSVSTYTRIYTYELPGWLSGKESACQGRRRGFDSWVGKIPWRRKWQPTAVFLPGKSHGQRSLVGYSS